MNKFTILFSLVISLTLLSYIVNAQELMVNGDLESWTNSTTPEGWDKVENVFQESEALHGGDYSASHVSQNSTTDFMQNVEGIIAGANYTISYWFLDNDPTARTRIWSYWTSGGSTLPDHEDILRPSLYSEDNPDWIKWEADLTAPPGADGFRFEVRVYKQDDLIGGSVYYDDFSVSSGNVAPEPSFYPTDFTAIASGLNIELAWNDSDEGQLPNAYLIIGSEEDNIAPPVDGEFISDDPDLSDGTGALNVNLGEEMATFSNLVKQTTYYFKIFPYTNGGPAVDYKTDGSAPDASATTENISIIEFMDFNSGWEDWTMVNVTGPQVWDRDNTFGLEGTPCAQISGYSGGAVVNEDWLISPAMDFGQYEEETFHFWTARNYDGPELEVMISSNYSGEGDPNSATWTQLTANLSTTGWEWTASGDIDVSEVAGQHVYVAFKYTSNSSDAASWELDDILLTGMETLGIDDPQQAFNISIYPNPTNDYLIVDGPEERYEFEITTITGQLVISQRSGSGAQIRIDELTTGIYFIRIRPLDKDAWAVRRFIVR